MYARYIGNDYSGIYTSRVILGGDLVFIFCSVLRDWQHKRSGDSDDGRSFDIVISENYRHRL
jgi:hypothetical protein